MTDTLLETVFRGSSRRLIALFIAVGALASGGCSDPEPSAVLAGARALAAPAGTGSGKPYLSVTPEGDAVLSWLEEVGRAAQPKRALVFGPGRAQDAIATHGEVEAAVVPAILVDAALAVSGARIRKVQRLREGLAAVLGAREQDVAAVRAAGEDDLLPQHEDRPPGIDGDARQP